MSSVEGPVEDTHFHYGPKLLVLHQYPQFSNKESNSNTGSACLTADGEKTLKPEAPQGTGELCNITAQLGWKGSRGCSWEQRRLLVGKHSKVRIKKSMQPGAEVSSGSTPLASTPTEHSSQPCDVAGIPPMARGSLSHARRLASATTSFLILQALLSA